MTEKYYSTTKRFKKEDLLKHSQHWKIIEFDEDCYNELKIMNNWRVYNSAGKVVMEVDDD